MNLSRVEKLLKFLESKSLYVHLNWIEETLHQIDASLNNKELEQQILQCLLNSDIKKALTPQSCLPIDIFDQHNQVLPGPYCLQIIHVQDIGISIFNQLEYLEQFDDSGNIKSYNIIRNNLSDVDDDDDIPDINNSPPKKFCKLILEDSSGLCVWAIEHKPIKEIHVAINLGAKILLKNILVLRGVLILNPSNLTFLGGEIFQLKNYFPSGFKNQLKSLLYNENQSNY
ncbi:hypothetical protein T552_00661 [Pneumocystis carinii B80]|uniref:RecQ-mediated genome instability protein 1 n=1 Tax=Pneumocystis carinii (strain B80) TaxID=1408658 RepID=A0A0W4ZP98_PNEC8|nr:hypothetical protein T552_00661 [Pneumocystis carinii B80]KTW30182.1 hypothetical protein T552_00661 [Pneumocystis carinii B80]